MERYQLLFNTAVLAGEITLESGAEIYRVEDTARRILSLTGFATAEVFATTTGLFVTLADPTDPDLAPVTQVRRINSRSANLHRIAMVNEVSRELCAGKIEPEEALQRLRQIRKTPPYPLWVVNLGFLLSTMGFAVIFGGGIVEVLISGICCLAMEAAGLLTKRITSGFMDNVIRTIPIAFVAYLFGFFLPALSVDIVIISSIMPLVPGVAITNAIRDTLQGDYNAGLARCAEAFVCALAIAVGSVAGICLCTMLIGTL